MITSSIAAAEIEGESEKRLLSGFRLD